MTLLSATNIRKDEILCWDMRGIVNGAVGLKQQETVNMLTQSERN